MMMSSIEGLVVSRTQARRFDLVSSHHLLGRQVEEDAKETLENGRKTPALSSLGASPVKVKISKILSYSKLNE